MNEQSEDIRSPEPLPGELWEHHSGRVYRVICVTNTTHPSEKFPPTVVYKNVYCGTEWSRPLSAWSESFKRFECGYPKANRDQATNPDPKIGQIWLDRYWGAKSDLCIENKRTVKVTEVSLIGVSAIVLTDFDGLPLRFGRTISMMCSTLQRCFVLIEDAP